MVLTSRWYPIECQGERYRFDQNSQCHSTISFQGANQIRNGFEKKTVASCKMWREGVPWQASGEIGRHYVQEAFGILHPVTRKAQDMYIISWSQIEYLTTHLAFGPTLRPYGLTSEGNSIKPRSWSGAHLKSVELSEKQPYFGYSLPNGEDENVVATKWI